MDSGQRKFRFSCVIPVKNIENNKKLDDLILSIRKQKFPQHEIEIVIVTEGDSESAKAIGIRRAKGEIIGMFCDDNMIMDNHFFSYISAKFNLYPNTSAIFTKCYYYNKKDNSLNRYFSLIGGNDPVIYYLGKNDRQPYIPELKRTSNYPKSYGCNGTFYRSELIKATDLDNYYPMDNAMEVPGEFFAMPEIYDAIWHRTSDNLISFLIKRYKYARDLYSDRSNRRWRAIDTRGDYFQLVLFALSTITIIPCIALSIRGFIKKRDWAWFYHWPVCLGFLVVYSMLAFRNLFKFGNFFTVQNVLHKN